MGAPALPEGLLASVKAYLDITWSDPETDRKVTDLIANGVVYLNGKIGSPGDYLSPGLPRSLLMDYVRYGRDGALDVFEENHRSMILGAQNRRRVTEYAAQAAVSCSE